MHIFFVLWNCRRIPSLAWAGRKLRPSSGGAAERSEGGRGEEGEGGRDNGLSPLHRNLGRRGEKMGFGLFLVLPSSLHDDQVTFGDAESFFVAGGGEVKGRKKKRGKSHAFMHTIPQEDGQIHKIYAKVYVFVTKKEFSQWNK